MDHPPVIGTLTVTLSSSLGSADQSGSVAPAEGDGDAWAERDAEDDADSAADAAGRPEQPEIRKIRMIARLGRTRRLLSGFGRASAARRFSPDTVLAGMVRMALVTDAGPP